MYYIIIIIESIAHRFIIILTCNISTTITNILVNTLYWYKNNIQFFYNIYLIIISFIKSFSRLHHYSHPVNIYYHRSGMCRHIYCHFSGTFTNTAMDLCRTFIVTLFQYFNNLLKICQMYTNKFIGI